MNNAIREQVYARQRGLVVKTEDLEGLTVSELLERARAAGLKATTKTRKVDLVEMLRKPSVDRHKLTFRQQRRLRKKVLAT